MASAAGIDHSPDMLALARERNAETVAAGRLELVEGDVHELRCTLLIEAGFTEASVDEDDDSPQVAVART